MISVSLSMRGQEIALAFDDVHLKADVQGGLDGRADDLAVALDQVSVAEVKKALP